MPFRVQSVISSFTEKKRPTAKNNRRPRYRLRADDATVYDIRAISLRHCPKCMQNRCRDTDISIPVNGIDNTDRQMCVYFNLKYHVCY